MTAEKALLAQAVLRRDRREDAAESLEELARLTATSGAEVVGTVTQELARPVSATLLGSGKLDLLKDAVEGFEADVVIFDNELTPVQNRNLEKALDIKVVDRTGLILDIFALRARSKEGKLQVELAQLNYMLPRLVGRWKFFSRLGGGIGTRGPGETQLEIDRRRIQSRIHGLKSRIDHARRTRNLHQAGRRAAGVRTVALVGYTNAGKSTLFNALSGSDAYTEDKLFATLDLTHRKIDLPTGGTVLLVDTIGFIQNLPHQLVEAFKATLDEVADADLLVHVIDASQPMAEGQEKVVKGVLTEIGAGEVPLLRVWNKIDRLHERDQSDLVCAPFRADAGDVCVSALHRTGIEDLVEAIGRALTPGRVQGTYLIPSSEGRALADLYQSGRVLRREDRDGAIELDAELDARNAGRFHVYRTG